MSHTPAPAVPVVAPGPRPGNAQWIGARQDQQDAFGFAGFDERGQGSRGAVLAVVADGMGGLSGGRTASQGAVSAFLAAWNGRPAQQPLTDSLLTAIEAANRAVHQLACATAGEGQVGTTLVAVAIADDQLYWIAAGDSRIYWYRAADGSLTACNEEHNLALQLWRQAPVTGMTRVEIDRHPERDHLTSFLGLATIPELDRNVRPLTLEPGDRLLLCSDGVDGTLTQDDLKASLVGDPQRAAEDLIALVQARNRPHQDNATVAILALGNLNPAPVGAPVSDPPTRRRPAEPPPRSTKNKAKTAIIASAGLILAGLLGIGGWYLLQGRPPQEASKQLTLPKPGTASPTAEKAYADTGRNQTEHTIKEGQGSVPEATASTSNRDSATGEKTTPAGDRSGTQTPAPPISQDTPAGSARTSSEDASRDQTQNSRAAPGSGTPAQDSATNLQPNRQSAAGPTEIKKAPPSPAAAAPPEGRTDGGPTPPSPPMNQPPGQQADKCPEQYRPVRREPTPTDVYPAQHPPGSGQGPGQNFRQPPLPMPPSTPRP